MRDNQQPDSPRHNWFERHPIKTLLGILLVFLLILMAITEKLLALKVKPEALPIERYIRLRELSPFHFEIVTLPREQTAPEGAAPNRILLRADREGYIIPSKVHEKPDFTLVFLGGSTTECRIVPEDLRFPYLVGRLLEKANGVKINSYNASRSGNNSLHSIDILLNKVMPLHPDVIIMMHNINDLSTLLYERTYWNEKPSGRNPIVEIKPSLRKNVKNIMTIIRSYTIPNIYSQFKIIKYQLTNRNEIDEFRHIRGKKVAIDKKFLSDEFRSNLQIFVDICKTRRIFPVLMTQANRFKKDPDPLIAERMEILKNQGIEYPVYKEVYDEFNQVIREVSGSNNTLLVDLSRLVPQEEKFMKDVVHFTDQGSQLVAEIIAREINPLVAQKIKAPKGPVKTPTESSPAKNE
jgi:lysophospholipase L1-like esterase